jgi:hypothetical protein
MRANLNNTPAAFELRPDDGALVFRAAALAITLTFGFAAWAWTLFQVGRAWWLGLFG